MSTLFLPKVAAVSVQTALLCLSTGAFAKEKEDDTKEVIVFGEQGESDTATNLELTIFETPQLVTAISHIQIDEFLLNKANDVLDYTPGVTVEEVETHRTYYTARGFDIVNFQYDGIGTPFAFGLVQGQLDAALYEKIEVVKGAAGLVTGLANPSATVNFVRKRPTQAFNASARLTLNEWSGYRLDGDVSGSINSSIRGLAVVANEDTESYLDRQEDETQLFYGAMEFDLGDNTLLTVGHSYDKNSADGILWGALPLNYSDGTATDYKVSTSSATDWAFRNTEESQSFIEVKHNLNNDWTLNAVYTLTNTDIESELFYVDGTPAPDETGLSAYTGRYLNGVDRNMFDINAKGYFRLADRDHQLVLGYNLAKVNITGAGFINSATGYPVLGADWMQGNTPRPDFNESSGISDVDQTYKSFYAATRLSVTNALSALVGARMADYEQTGISYGGSAEENANDTVPYFGLTYQITDSLMAYGSFSEVFAPQVFVDTDLNPLGAIEGESTNLGMKVSFNDDLALFSFSVFESAINNYGVYVGDDPNTGVATYSPRTQESKGFEVEIIGQMSENLNISAGFTLLDIEDASAGKVPYIPEQMFKASASYTLPSLPALKLGGVLKWQDDTTTASGMAKQKAYTLLDVFVQYQITDHLSAGLNIDNLTDEKYLNSLYWAQAYYGAPRNITASFRLSY